MTTPTPTINSFDDLVQMALDEPDPPQLLTVMIRAEAVHAGGDETHTRALEGEGLLKPVMVKSHSITPDLCFAHLKAEADQQDDRWAFIMIAILPGQGGRPPAPPAVDENLKHMARTLLVGGDLSRYLFVNREGEPVQISAPVDMVRSGAGN